MEVRCREDFIDYGILVDIVGEELAEKVCEVFGGRSVYFPRRLKIDAKHRRLVNDYEKYNLSYRELAEKYGYSESHIRYIINKIQKERRKKRKQNNAQPSLFDNI